MNKVCKECGNKNPAAARFCGSCGGKFEDESGNRPAVSAETPRGRFCEFGRAYILKALALLACVVVFISGFFTTVEYIPQESLQSNIFSESADLETMLDGVGFEQNVFNVFPALFVGVDDTVNSEEAEKIVEQIEIAAQEIFEKYSDRLTELSLLASQGNARAQSQLVKLMRKIVNEFRRSVSNINLIKLDALESELNYSAQSSNEVGRQGLQALKAAQDLDIRTGIMVGYSAGYVYLQIVSLVYLIVAAASLFNKKSKGKFGKFFVLYLSGFFFMFAIGQLTACSLGGAGMFCFVFALVIGALYLAGKIAFTNRLTLRDIAPLALKGLALVFSFSAVALLLNNYIIFTSVVNKVGAAFGMHAYDSYSFASQSEVTSFTLVNFLPAAVLYCATLALSAVSLFKIAKAEGDFRKKESSLLPVACVSAGVGLLSYLTLSVLGMANVTESYMHTDAFASIVFSVAAIVFVALARVFDKMPVPVKSEEQNVSETTESAGEAAAEQPETDAKEEEAQAPSDGEAQPEA